MRMGHLSVAYTFDSSILKTLSNASLDTFENRYLLLYNICLHSVCKRHGSSWYSATVGSNIGNSLLCLEVYKVVYDGIHHGNSHYICFTLSSASCIKIICQIVLHPFWDPMYSTWIQHLKLRLSNFSEIKTIFGLCLTERAFTASKGLWEKKKVSHKMI